MSAHGTRKMYREAACRCSECKRWNAEQKRAYDERVKERDGISVTQKYRPRRNPARECVACGEMVTGWVRSDAPRHNACRPPKNWANAIQVSKRERLAIYERDGWACQLCSEPVDPALDPLHRMAATLDHITPRAFTLFPDDSPENLRLAHRACNSARGVGERVA